MADQVPVSLSDLKGNYAALVGLPSVADRCGHPAANYLLQSLSGGGSLGANFRSKHTTASAVTALELWYNLANGGTVGPNAVTMACAVEYPSGTFTPCYWSNGTRKLTFDPGGIVRTALCPVNIPASTPFWIRTYVLLPSTTANLYLSSFIDDGVGEGWTAFTADTDLTTSGTIAANAFYGLRPLAIKGLGTGAFRPCLAGVGDSIMYGFGSSGNSPDTSWVGRGLTGGAIPWANYGVPGETAVIFSGTAYLRAGGLTGFTHLIFAHGINDLRGGSTLAQIQAQMQANWQYGVSLGAKVYQTTITPNTDSADGWTTTNQTAHIARVQGRSTGDPSDASDRSVLNNWIRTTPAPLSGYIEAADAVETARNSGIWKPNYTADGLHPADVGHTALANLIPASLFV